VVVWEDNRGRWERRAITVVALQPTQLGLAGAVQLARLDRQWWEKGQLHQERVWLATSLPAHRANPEQLLNLVRLYWLIEGGCHQRLDVSLDEDRSRVRRKNAATILGLLSRVGLALYQPWAERQPLVRDRTFPTWQQHHQDHRAILVNLVTRPV
jgi:predicted transposase YbfD/YdcC